MEKKISKDPFVAFMFSLLFPGLGQIYSGRFKKGVLCSTVYLILIGALILFLFPPSIKTGKYLLFLLYFLIFFEIFVLLDAYLGAKASGSQHNRSFAQKILIPLGVLFSIFVFNFNILLINIVSHYFALAPRMRSNSMSPLLIRGDWFLANKSIYKHTDPARGDVVFFRFDYPKGNRRVVVKRLIAHGGETVEIKEGDVYINNQRLNMPEISNIYYTNAGDYGKANQSIEVPEAHYYVLGDNNKISIDSRIWGFVPRKNILGKAHKIIYPFDRSGPIY